MADKITLTNLADLQNEATAVLAINTNNAVLTTAMDNTLSRDGTQPNQMGSNLDMNSNRVLNLPNPINGTEPLRLTDASVLNGGGTIATFPTGGTTGQVLGKANNGDFNVLWENSVTSTGLALPSDFTVTNSPVTTTGTLTGAWALTPTGTGAMVRATSPTLVTPLLGTPTSGVATNLTGTAAGLTSGHVTTNANLTGPITSVGNATSVAAQTGTGSTFVMNTSPVLVTPALGTPTSGVATNLTGTAAGLTAGNVTTNANLTGPITSTGNATTVASQTGTGSTFVMNTSPVLITPLLGTPTSGVATNLTGTAAGLTAGNVTTNANLTGDITSVGNATTLATVASAGTTGSSTAIPVVTINAKGLTTGITTAAVIAPANTLSGTTLASGVTGSSLTSFGVSPVLGIPASGTLTNCTGTAAGLTAGNVTTNANLTGDVTSVGNATTLTNAPVIAKVLTGFVSGAGTIAAADSILTAFNKADGNTALKAPIASPTFTGVPAAPTAAVDTNTTQLATTAMVLAQAASATPLIDGTATVGTSTRFARGDHIHPTDTTRLAVAGGQTLTGGFTVTPNNLGTISSGTVTPAAASGNYQFYTNNGAHTLAAPAADCGIDILITNGATAGAITLSGFTVGTTGDSLTTTNTSKFIISIRRINAIATYVVKALQ